MVDCVWNVTAHAQKPTAKRTSPFKSAGASVQSTAGSRGVRISGSNAGYTVFRGSVKSTGYPLHSPVSPSLPHPCVTVCHHISTEVYVVSRGNVRTRAAERVYTTNTAWNGPGWRGRVARAGLDCAPVIS